MTIETLTTFFGWCTVINFVILGISTLALVCCRSWITGIHSKLMGVEESALAPAYFQYLGQYKIVTLTLNLAPYLALKIMGS